MNFDRLAPFYQAMEWIAAGRKLQSCRMAFVGKIPAPNSVLLAGEGHGRFLPECLKRFPDARIMVVDSSRVMLEIARKKLENDCLERVEFIHADLERWQAPIGRFDLIVTHFFLDCFPFQSVAGIVRKLAEAAAPEAEWLLADFQIANGRFSRLRSRWILSLLYGFFRISCQLKARSLTPPDPFLKAAGFVMMDRREFDWGLLKSEWWRR